MESRNISVKKYQELKEYHLSQIKRLSHQSLDNNSYYLLVDDEIVGYIYFQNLDTDRWTIIHNADELSQDIAMILYDFMKEYLLTNGYKHIYDIVKID